MSSRNPAGEDGTADRIATDDGGYWVRLVTKEAIRREGECMDNCCASGDYDCFSGGEEMVSTSLWSLRKSEGVSYMLVEVDAHLSEVPSAEIDQARGPLNSQPSCWSIRQIRHLVQAFAKAGADLHVPSYIALTGEGGRTWRPDKAPVELWAAHEAQEDPNDVFNLMAARSDQAGRFDDVKWAEPTIIPLSSAYRGEGFLIEAIRGLAQLAPTVTFGVDTQDPRPFNLGLGPSLKAEWKARLQEGSTS